MLESKGNLWNFEGIHCITTNGFVKNDGTAVMGRGCAKEARDKYPDLPAILGTRLNNGGNHIYYFESQHLITYPVKHVWWKPADLALIRVSALGLMRLIKTYNLIEPVYLPRPGCGNGQLTWQDVKPLIETVLSNQVTVITF